MDLQLSITPLSVSRQTVVLGLAGTYFLILALYRLFLSPLSSVPGPWFAAVSELWLTTHVLRLRRCRAIDELLQRYGPIVRVAPNKVIFLDAPTMKIVYGVGSKLDKSSFYKCLTTNANDHAMTVLDHGSHVLRKRGYAAHYIPTNLVLFQPEIYKCTQKLVNVLFSSTSVSPTAVDCLLLFRHFFIDINSIHLFDYEANSLKAWSQHVLCGGPPDEMSRAISDFPKRGLLRGALPSWLWNLIQTIPIGRWQEFCDSDAFLGRYGMSRLQNARDALCSGKEDSRSSRRPLVSRLLAHKYSEEEPMPDRDIVSECLGHFVAGTDTTSTTLSYLLWELSRRRDIMRRLQAEVDKYMPDSSRLPDMQELSNLPYLTAFIKEGLRVYSSAPSPLERVVPEGRDSSINLCGYNIPAGTIIASQAFSSHRRSDVFFSPDLFLPDRWLMRDSVVSPASCLVQPTDQPTSSAEKSQSLSDAEKGSKISSETQSALNQSKMASHMFPFGYGPRVCGGQNLAQIMLRVVLVAIVRNFDIVAPQETNEKSMAMRDSFVAFPAAMECKLIFIPRGDKE